MHFTILCVGKLKEDYMRKAVADYVLRLSKYAKTEVIEVGESDIPGEGDALLKRIAPGSSVVAMDLHGKMIDSPALASWISQKTLSGTSHFTFVIGGSDGIDNRICQMADLRLCLSPMTFTHQMTRLILAEQLYRAMKINAGEKYHK
ncbi:MAG: 23S rRNA (pseudouridine(1915)-N(3))-methyltransferase RlmH [Clostridia bacterium]|nr:23S rRNA (pseudouridine(1915)-N(3))-methyltransferase RlmH [Clostridia bacterium]